MRFTLRLWLIALKFRWRIFWVMHPATRSQVRQAGLMLLVAVLGESFFPDSFSPLFPAGIAVAVVVMGLAFDRHYNRKADARSLR